MDELRNFDEFTEWDDSREIKIRVSAGMEIMNL